VILAGRVPIEVDERRRRLQERLGCGVPDLLTIALERLETELALDAGGKGSSNKSAAAANQIGSRSRTP
jgi:hypothetical protein